MLPAKNKTVKKTFFGNNLIVVREMGENSTSFIQRQSATEVPHLTWIASGWGSGGEGSHINLTSVSSTGVGVLISTRFY